MLVTLAAVLFAWTHRHALSLTGFADDLGLLAELPQRATSGELWSDVATRLTGPLWPQSTMWRPLPYASFALDARMWGEQAGGWHLTNLLLHLASAVLVGFVVRDLHLVLHRGVATETITDGFRASANAGGAMAFALFLLCPWAPEVTLWLVGRFDGWATLFVLLALWAGLRSRASIRLTIVSVLAAVLAYASKESALILLPWLIVAIGLTAPSRNASTPTAAGRRSWVLLIIAHSLLVVAYATWRHHLFGGTAAAVYGSSPSFSIWRWLQQFAAQLAFPAGLASLAAPAAALSAGGAALLLVAGWREHAGRRLRLLGLTMVVSVIAALALYLPAPPGDGEGYRLYYLAAAGFAVALGAMPRRMTALQWAAIVVLLLACTQWQSRVAAEWTHASRDMRAAEAAARAVATTTPPSDYALLLMPDQQCHVPFARNAQGALLALAQRTPAGDAAPVDLLSRLIVFTPPQLNEWQRLAQEGVVSKLTTRIGAPANPTRYLCFDPGTGIARNLGYWPPVPAAEWSAKWRQAVAQHCPTLQANWP